MVRSGPDGRNPALVALQMFDSKLPTSFLPGQKKVLDRDAFPVNLNQYMKCHFLHVLL